MSGFFSVGGGVLAALKAQLAAGGASLIGLLQGGVGAVMVTVEALLKDTVSLRNFGATLDKVADDSAALQKAVNYCLSSGRARTLRVTGPCRLAASSNVNRLIGTTATEFRIVFEGEGAGFYPDNGVTIFDSTIAMANDPVTGEMTFEGGVFEAGSIADTCYVMSKKFLRMTFNNCEFNKIRLVDSDKYVQDLRFNNCKVRYNPANFIRCDGLYDVVFDGGYIQYGYKLVRNVSTARGTSSLKLIGGIVIEGAQETLVQANGVSGFELNAHMELNATPTFNFFVGGPANNTIAVRHSVIINPAGPTFYYGPTDTVISEGNYVAGSTLHTQVSSVTNFVSIGDVNKDGSGNPIAPADVTLTGVMGGIRTNATSATLPTLLALGVSGESTLTSNVGIGRSPVAGTRCYMRGAGLTSATISAVMANVNGFATAVFFDDRTVQFPALGSASGTTAVIDASGNLKLQSSSRRYKENIVPFGDGIDWVKNCGQVVTYNLKENGEAQVGFIAEDFSDKRFVTYRHAGVETHRLVVDMDDEGGAEIQPYVPDTELIPEGVNYAQMVAPVIQAMRQLIERVELLEQRAGAGAP